MSGSVGIYQNRVPELFYSPPQENRFPEYNKLSREKGEEIFTQISLAQSENEESEFDSRPVLRRVNEHIRLTLDAQIMKLLREADQNNERFLEKRLLSRLALLNAQLETHKKELNLLSADIEKATSECQKLLNDLQVAYHDQEEIRQLLSTAQEQLSALESRLAELDRQGMAQDDPQYLALQQEIVTAKVAVTAAATALTKVQSELLQLEQRALEMVDQRDGLLDKLTGLIYLNGNLVMESRPLVEAQQQSITLRDLINVLLLKMIEQSSENTLAKLKNDQALNKARREATQASMMEQANKAAEQERKAQEAAQKANCISKILGGVLTALGALTMAFGGAGTALMVIGLGMLVMDTLSQALFGFSISEKLLSPLIEHIFMPLMEQIGNLVNAILSQPPFSILLRAINEATGTNVSGIIQTAVAAAVTIVAIIAVAFLLKSAGKALYNKIGKAIGQAVVEQVKNAIKSAVSHLPSQLKHAGAAAKQLMQQLKTMLDELLAKLPVSPRSVAGKLGSLADATTLSKTGAEQTYAIVGAEYDVQAAKSKGALIINKKVLHLLTENLNRALKIMAQSEALKNDLVGQMSELLQTNYKTATFIAKQKLTRRL